nr:hypothetical protein [Tanacetum cinerariifolium]
MEKMIAKAILQERGNIRAQISSQIQQAIDNDIPSQVDASVMSYLSGHILHVHLTQPQTTYVPEQQYQLYLLMKDDPQRQQQDIAIWLALQIKFKRLQVPQTTCRTPAVAQEIRTILMMMLILRERIVQSGRRNQSMEHMYMESHRLDKIMNMNKVYQHQVIKNK